MTNVNLHIVTTKQFGAKRMDDRVEWEQNPPRKLKSILKKIAKPSFLLYYMKRKLCNMIIQKGAIEDL